MVRVTFALFGLVDASFYGRYRYTNCYSGHGAIPIKQTTNVTEADCEVACDDTKHCVGFTRHYDRYNRHNPYGNCTLHRQVTLSECDVQSRSSYETYTQAAEPPLEGNVVYHLFERKYSGLANKDAGDFKGDTGFIFNTFTTRWSAGNPEASMDHNIIEMSEINVTGWGRYEECNAPGANGQFNCPSNQTDYCCTHRDENHHNIPAVHTADQLPGLEVNKESLGREYGFGGWWFSFPAESEGNTWTQKLVRRIDGQCMGNAWRKDAGGCDSCNATLDSCVADCIKSALCKEGSTDLLQATWDRVFADRHECPNVPLPGDAVMVV